MGYLYTEGFFCANFYNKCPIIEHKFQSWMIWIPTLWTKYKLLDVCYQYYSEATWASDSLPRVFSLLSPVEGIIHSATMRRIPGTSRVLFVLQVVWLSVLSPVYCPRSLLHLLSSLSDSFWQAQATTNYPSVFYPFLLFPFQFSMISFCLKTVLCVQIVVFYPLCFWELVLHVSGSRLLLCTGAVCLAGYAVSLHRGEAEILGPEGSWGPDFLLWSHPRRCPSLWAFSQVSASGCLLYLQLEGQMRLESVDHIQVCFFVSSWLVRLIICSLTINWVDNLMSSLLSGLSEVSSPMLMSLLSESCLGLQESSLERPQSLKKPEVASN